MKKRVCAVFLSAVLILFSSSLFVVAANAADDFSVQSYREELLISYCEFWYKDGAGTVSHVRYNEVYKTVTYLHSCRLVNQEIEKLPINDPDFPSGTIDAQKVTNIYEYD